MPPQPILRSLCCIEGIVFAWSVLSSVGTLPYIFLLLCKNAEHMMKFAGAHHYRKQIKWLHFWAKLEKKQGS